MSARATENLPTPRTATSTTQDLSIIERGALLSPTPDSQAQSSNAATESSSTDATNAALNFLNKAHPLSSSAAMATKAENTLAESQTGGERSSLQNPKATYNTPTATHTFSLPAPTSQSATSTSIPISSEAQINHLSTAIPQLQEQINQFLTAKMEEDAAVAGMAGRIDGSGVVNGADVLRSRDEDMYGEEEQGGDD